MRHKVARELGAGMAYRIVIADDHPFIVEGIKTALTDAAEFEVVGTAKNGIQAIALIKQFQPDCAVLDLSMPGANGMDVYTEGKKLSPKTRFAIVTGTSAAVLFTQLYEAGIDGLFFKNTPAVELAAGILRIVGGERVFSDEAVAAIEDGKFNNVLSKREHDILQAIARGQSNNQAAKYLGISPKTVDTHRTNLLRKMQVNSTAALLVKAMKTGLIKV